jgi:glycine/D-amino acid oxidase-like deaminating enzyme
LTFGRKDAYSSNNQLSNKGMWHGMRKPSVVVIGAGVIGLTAAWQLVCQGAEVTVIAGLDPSRAISWGTVAWSNASSKVRLGYPDHYTILNQLGMAAGLDLSRQLGGTPWLHVTGAVEIVDGASARAQLETDVSRLGDFGYPAEALDAERFKTLLPGVRLGSDEAAALFPSDAWIDAPALLQSLTVHIAAAGGRFRHDEVVGADRVSDALTTLRLASGDTLTADRFLVAAGAWSGSVGALLGIDIPVLPPENPRVPGLVASVTVAENPLTPILLTPEVIIRPFGPTRVLLAGDDHGHTIGPDSSRSELFAAGQVLLDRAAARAEQFTQSAVLDVRLGLRSIPEDGITIAGVPSGTSNAYVLTTHSGFSLAPLLGRLAAQEIVHGSDDDTLSPYRPSRFDTTRPALILARVDSASSTT